ncbi:MAG: hypothetical protein RR623_02405 [Bacilli bacterium]
MKRQTCKGDEEGNYRRFGGCYHGYKQLIKYIIKSKINITTKNILLL